METGEGQVEMKGFTDISNGGVITSEDELKRQQKDIKDTTGFSPPTAGSSTVPPPTGADTWLCCWLCSSEPGGGLYSSRSSGCGGCGNCDCDCCDCNCCECECADCGDCGGCDLGGCDCNC